MKLWELDWTEGRQYKDRYGDVWTVKDGELEDSGIRIFVNYTSKELVSAEFRPYIDWSEVEVDTKILVSEDGFIWNKRYFAKYEDEKVFAFDGSYTSWITKRSTSWKYAKLAEEAQND